MTLLERVEALLRERETEREQIKARRQTELEAVAVQIAALKKAQRKLQADPDIEAVLAELTACGLWPSKG